MNSDSPAKAAESRDREDFVIDDDPKMLEVYKEILMASDHEVLIAERNARSGPR